MKFGPYNRRALVLAPDPEVKPGGGAPPEPPKPATPEEIAQLKADLEAARKELAEMKAAGKKGVDEIRGASESTLHALKEKVEELSAKLDTALTAKPGRARGFFGF